ncbi:MAG: HAMP domain-containing protein, partial [Candidatus Electrothrix sp. AR1]|nr:HAMP domain-containing protein [Candidatus Electrothrix sp. AR1]
MMLTVLVLVTLISGTSILISYYVTGQKIERDVATEFFNTESVAGTCFDLFSRQLLFTAKSMADELVLRQMQDAGGERSLTTMFRTLKGKKSGDVFFLINTVDEVIAFSEKNLNIAESLARYQAVHDKMATGQSFSTIIMIDSGRGMGPQERKRFYMIAAVPVLLPYSSQSFFVFSCYLMDSSFLLRFPIYSHMDITLVSDNSVVATTLPPEDTLQEGDKYPFYKSSVLLPGAIDLIHESSFFKEKMYVKIKYIPGMENSTTSFIIFSHPSRLVLATKKEFGQHFIIILFVGLCCSIMLIFFITGSVLNPIKELNQLVHKISDGDLNNRIESSVTNEFTPLINQFNNMLNLIQRKDEELWDIVEAKTTELRQRNIFIDNLLRSSQVMGIVATDMNLVVTYFNPVAEKLFGFKAEEVVGKRVTEFHPHIKNREEQFNILIDNALRKGSHTFTVGTSDFPYDTAGMTKEEENGEKNQRIIEV